ncbi:hypothetical protein TNCV_3247721 [Trichonephila clavipes]|nr:hypothetical protein TNCV_3247721 [Trichonephila clavipes]
MSMVLAAAEVVSFNNGSPNVPVTIDGTWQKMDPTSINGVVTAVNTLHIQPGFYRCRTLQKVDLARIRKEEKAQFYKEPKKPELKTDS